MDVDEKLIRACIRGDRKAQFELYDKCFSTLMSVCRRYRQASEDLNDLLNMGFYKILKGLPKYKGSAPFEAWMRRVMINTIIDEYRKTARGPEIVEMNAVVENMAVGDFDAASAYRFDSEELEEMLLHLPVKSRQVFNLFAIDGYGHKEVAEMMCISVGTSKWHLANARNKLQQMMAERQQTTKASGL